MDPTNIIMFLLFFCVTGAMAVDPQLQKNQWNVLSGVTVWNGKPQYEFRINWFLLLCGALGAIVQDGWTLLQTTYLFSTRSIGKFRVQSANAVHQA